MFSFCSFFTVKNMQRAPNKGAFTLGLLFAGRGGACCRKASACHWEEWGMGALLLGVTSRRNPETTPATHEQDRQDERMAGHAVFVGHKCSESVPTPRMDNLCA